MKIKKGDTVIIRAGKHKGTAGEVLQILRDSERVIVQGGPQATLHTKARSKGTKGEISKKDVSIHISNIALVDPKTKKPTRIGMRMEDTKKHRVAKKSNTALTS